MNYELIVQYKFWPSLDRQKAMHISLLHVKVAFGDKTSSYRSFIVWQRFCEPARLRIAYCPWLAGWLAELSDISG